MKGSTLGDALKRALEANMQYYSGLIQLTTDYVKVLGSVVQNEVKEAAEQRRAEPLRAVHVQEQRARATSPEPAREQAGSSSPRADEPQLVLQGVPGEVVRAGFRVTNTLPHEVTAVIKAAPVLDAHGAPAEVAIAATPGVVTLAPGAAQAVMIAAEIPAGMPSSASYQTRIEVPGLAADGVRLVIKCIAPKSEPKPAAASKSNAGTGSAGTSSAGTTTRRAAKRSAQRAKASGR